MRSNSNRNKNRTPDRGDRSQSNKDNARANNSALSKILKIAIGSPQQLTKGDIKNERKQ